MAGRKNLNKNAISAFEEYGTQQRKTPKFMIVDEEGPPHKPVFTVAAFLGDNEICQEQGSSKHEAKIKAAERSLQILSVLPQNSESNEDTESSAEPSPSLENPVPYKDPVSAITEYSQYSKHQVSFELLSQEGPHHMPMFQMAVKLGTVEFDTVTGTSMKEAKKKAACMALNQLQQEGALQELFPDVGLKDVNCKKNSKTRTPALDKNPVSVFYEYAQKACLTVKFDCTQAGPPHKPVFTVSAIMGDERFPVVEASSKSEGRVLASEAALEFLTTKGLYSKPTAPEPQSNNGTTGLSQQDRVGYVSHVKFEELLVNIPEALDGRKILAAILMLDEKTDKMTVVSLGSGNRCIKGDHINDEGTVLHDSHAEIIARRAFMRFLYKLIKLAENSGEGELLEKQDDGKWTFIPNISFHLYISTAPCGDGALFTHSEPEAAMPCPEVGDSKHKPVFSNPKTQGLLRAKQENGEGTIPIEPDFAGQTYDGIHQGGRLRIMSCSDKICQWNVVGLQGALLSNFIHPVYLKSLTLGNLFHHGHLSRAVCCRVDRNNALLGQRLPVGYQVNHTEIGVVTTQHTTRAVDKARPLSINWCFGDTSVEVTDGTQGMTVRSGLYKYKLGPLTARGRQTRIPRVGKNSEPSRLCKKEFLDLYRELRDDKDEIHMTYRQLKMNADVYNVSKMAFQQRMQEQGYGNWIPMPKEVDWFQ